MEMVQKVLEDPDFERKLIAATPLRRLAEPAAVARAAAFLALPDSDDITGQLLPVDGGYLGMLVNWGFLAFMFATEYDIVLALGKVRRAGFVRHPDTLEGFYRQFDASRHARIIPTF